VQGLDRAAERTIGVATSHQVLEKGEPEALAKVEFPCWQTRMELGLFIHRSRPEETTQRLNGRLLIAPDAERRRVVRELHETTVQTLADPGRPCRYGRDGWRDRESGR